MLVMLIGVREKSKSLYSPSLRSLSLASHVCLRLDDMEQRQRYEGTLVVSIPHPRANPRKHKGTIDR